jgi:enoyl-[acyl-carrier protein] reductase I
MIPSAPAKLLEGKRGLVVGIANDQSIAWGCARAFRALGSELAVTYLNEKAKRYVEPLARELEASILMPLDVRVPGQMEAVYERITKQWGRLDFAVHSIAFSPKEALQGRVVDVERDGFLTTMEVSCWSFIRMAHLAEPLMKNGGTLFTMTYYGSRMVVKNYNMAGSITKCNTFLAGCCDGNQLRAFDGRGAGDADGDAGGWLQPARGCSLPWSQSVHH